MVLQIRPPELARLPWEFMFDSSNDEYVCLRTPLIRYPLVLTPVLPMRVSAPLRVLGMVARPDDKQQLATSDETDRLETALGGLIRDGKAELSWVNGQSWRDLQDAMWQGPWHVFHFIGHGETGTEAETGSVALVNEDGGTYRLGADQLAMLLADHRTLRLIVLNACETDRGDTLNPFSSVARTLIRRGASAVLAMQNEITDRAALEFSRTFYGGLAAMLPVDHAVMHARRAIHLAVPGSLEWGTPVLYMHSANGSLFASADSPVDVAGYQGAAASPADRPTEDGMLSARQELADCQVLLKPSEMARIRAPDQVNAVTFNADGSQLAFACDGRLALVVDEMGRECLRIRHDIAVTCVSGIAVDPAAGLQVATAADKAARIWDMKAGRLRLELRHMDTVRALAFSSDGRLLATGSIDKTARIWDAATGRQILEFPHAGSVLAVAFSPDGSVLATGSTTGIVILWTTRDGSELCTIRNDGQVRAIAFSPDGRLLATAGTDRAAHLWDTATWDQLTEIPHTGAVRAIAFSPDGRLLATAGTDRAAHLWDTATWDQLTEIPHTGPVRAIAFSPDGQLLATGSKDNVVQLWRIREDGNE